MSTNAIIDNIKKYKSKSIFFRILFIQLLTLSLPVIIICYMVLSYYGISSKSQTELDMTRDINGFKNVINSMIDAAEESYYRIIQNEDVRIWLGNNDMYSSFLEESSANTAKMFHQEKTIISNYYESVYFYNMNSGFVLADSSYVSSSAAETFADDIRNMPQKYMFERKTYIDGVEYKYLTIRKDVYMDGGIKGTVIFNTNKKWLENHIRNICENFYLVVDDNGEIVYTNFTDEILGIVPDSETLKELCLENSGILYENELFDKNNIYIMHDHENSLSFIGMSTVKDINFTATVIGIIIGVILLTLLISAIMSYLFYKIIISLILVIENPLKNDVDGNEPNELTYIGKMLMNSINEKLKVENELASKIQKINETSLMGLQLQINPHFLFNTLQMIGTTSLKIMKRDTEINEIVAILSKLMRKAIDTQSYIHSLDEELEIAEDYLKLQNLRYDGEIELSLDIAPETRDKTVLKFYLQPILENSIIHGFRDYTGTQKKIEICSWIEKNIMYVVVRDNGKGISEVRLKEFEKYLSEPPNEGGSSIGLRNVNNRIKLIFGDEFRLDIKSNNSGTEIIIKFPA